MALDENSLANAVGASVRNTQFQPQADVVQRRIGIVATYDPAILTIVDETPVRILSAEDAGAKFGFGFMAYRLARGSFKGSKNIETYIIPQSETVGAVAAAGDIDFTVVVAVAGTIYLYLAGDRVAVDIPAEILGVPTTGGDVATLIVAAVNVIAGIPVVAAVDAIDLTQVNFTAKSTGPYGNDISIEFNLGAGEELPGGVSVVTVDMAAGAGIPIMANALDNGLGTGDIANELGITDFTHGYGQDATTLSAISAYVGEGNTFTGLYAKTVARPFRALTGDTAPDTAALTALIAITDARKTDRADGIIAVPGSASHPSEIAAQAIGHMARINNLRAEESYTDIVLVGVWPGAAADQWTADYDARDLAVKSGISPTTIKSGAVVMQNVVSFYRPDSVPVASNGYRSMRNISITQNVLNSVRLNFEQAKWQGISIVSDVNRVGNATSKLKARDTSSVLDDLVALALNFEDRAWIFSSSFTIDGLQDVGSVTIRAGGTGFDSLLKLIYSGEGGILDTVVEFDTSIAAALS